MLLKPYPYLQDTSHLGLDIRDASLPHFRADSPAGHLELRERTGATILANPGMTKIADWVDGFAAWEAMGKGLEVTDMT